MEEDEERVRGCVAQADVSPDVVPVEIRPVEPVLPRKDPVEGELMGGIDGERAARAGVTPDAVPTPSMEEDEERVRGCVAKADVSPDVVPIEIQPVEPAMPRKDPEEEELMGSPHHGATPGDWSREIGVGATYWRDEVSTRLTAREDLVALTGQACVFSSAENSPLEALEALVFVETVASRAPISPTLADGALKVYYRRKRRTRTHSPPRGDILLPQLAVVSHPPTQAASETHSDVPAPLSAVEPHPPPQPDVETHREDHEPANLSRKTFIDNLTKKTDGVLARPPTIQKRRVKAPPPTSAPRRSRRTAGLGAEFAGCPDIGARKTVIRSLDLAIEREHVDQRILNDYAKLFGRSLSASHVQALAALFGWAVPEGTRNISTTIQC
jgi:hypothetical protein